MAQLTQPKKLTSIVLDQPHLESIQNGDLDNQKLREFWRQSGEGIYEFCDIIESATGRLALVCDCCGKLSFAETSISAYYNAYNICVQCSGNFSLCQKCQTFVRTEDLGNPTHAHQVLLDQGNYFYEDYNVEAYNADIMTLKKMFYLKTPEEQEIWKHQKECGIFLLQKPHSNQAFRYFGVELEVEKIPAAPPDMINRTKKLMGDFVMLKHDGSLGNKGKNGFEMVSVPSTMAYHKSGVWDKFFNDLGLFFEYQPPTTGLHVHVGLDTVSKMTSAKAVVFVNSKENQEFIESIAQRDLNVPNPNGKIYAGLKPGWKVTDIMRTRQHGQDCPWNAKNKNVNTMYVMKNGVIAKDSFGNPIISHIKPNSIIIRPTCKCSAGLYNLEKYEAINLMTKRPTIEFRIFRGVMDKDFLYAALEFGDALIDFCGETLTETLSYRNFLNWIKRYNESGMSKLYPYLSRHLINKGWLDPKKSTPRLEARTV